MGFTEILQYRDYLIVMVCFLAVLFVLWRKADLSEQLHFDNWFLVTMIISGTLFHMRKGIEAEIYFQVILWLEGLGIYSPIKRYKRIPKTNMKWSLLRGYWCDDNISDRGTDRIHISPQQRIDTAVYNTGSTILVFLRYFLYQFSYVAPFEELIFRGFLWYYLEFTWME